MNKILFYMIGSLILVSAFSVISVDAASVMSEVSEQKEVVPFKNLQDYQVLLTGNENGISTYSGLKNNIRISFDVDASEIKKIIIAFDLDTSSAQNKQDIAEIVDVVDRIYPQKISDKQKAEEELLKKLSEMNQARDDDIFNVEQLKVEAHVNNGMANLRITK